MKTPDMCLNCGAPLTGPFCAKCGQKKRNTDVTLREFLRETTHELTHWDGKGPQTLKALFFEPGLLTVDFLQGRRARWLSPLRLYLICSITFFLTTPVIEAVTHRWTRGRATVVVAAPDGTTTLTREGRRKLKEVLAAQLLRAARLERDAASNARLNQAIDTAYPKAMFVLLPVFALLTSIGWRRARPRYPAHLYLALHLHAAWFGAFAVTTMAAAFISSDLADTIIGGAGVTYAWWYGLVTLHRVFQESWTRTITKTLFVAVVYSLCFFLVSLGLLAYAVSRV